MKIAVLAHCHHPIKQPFPGGLEAHTSLIADELVGRGHRVTLFAKAGSRSLADVHPVVDGQFVHGSAPDVNGVDQSQAIVDRGMERAVQAIDAGDFDVVLNNSLNPVPYVALGDHPMLTLLHTPATLERTLEVLEAPGWRPGARHAYAAVSEYTARDWRRFLPEVHCIPNGIELAAWDPRQPYCPVPVPDLAVWAARITPEKNLPLAIAAARAAGMRLEFSGPISDRRHFGEEIEPLLGADVRYAGHLTHDQLPDFFARGSVFISSPAWAEPFGLAMVEAMACGTPVAALARGAAAEVVSSGGGVLARTSTVEGLATAIRDASRLDRRGVRRSAQLFDKSIMLHRYETMLRELASFGGPVVELHSPVPQPRLRERLAP
jgi:glycosyltransferase involved in cell wall biosynthesis